MMKRADVYGVIDDERDYQDTLGADRTDGRHHNVAEELVIMRVYLNRAFDAWVSNPGDQKALEQIKKVVATGVRTMENWYD
jgi:hypothetical protein